MRLIAAVTIFMAIGVAYDEGKRAEHRQLMSAILNELPGMFAKDFPNGCRP